jgi:protein-disulfide isomerase
MNKKFWIALLIIIVGVFGLAITQSNKDSAIKRKVENPKAVQADDHIRGKSDSKVYLITYGDYECPACNAWEPEIQKIKDEYKDRVAFIFRNLPLTDKHINAFAAARAAEAANLQGKFWEMHDLLYVKWEEWNGDNKSAQTKFETYAQELGLDMAKFKTDYQSEVVADRINSDLVTASAVGADGTPTFLINGEKVKVDAVSSGKTEIRRLLDQKLSAQ